MTSIVPVLDSPEHLERVGYPIIQLRRDVAEILIVAVDETGELGLAQVDAIIQAIDRRAAARAEMRSPGSERIQRRIQFVFDRAGGRLLGHVIDGTADRIQ